MASHQESRLAAFNGAFALTGLLTCFFSPYHYGSTFLLLTSLQDVFWYTAIVRAGGFGFADCLGVSTRGLYVIEERLSRDVMKATKGIKEELHVIEAKGREKFGAGGGGGGHQGTYSDAVKRDGRTEAQRWAATDVETTDNEQQEYASKEEYLRKGFERSDLGTPIPSSVN